MNILFINTFLDFGFVLIFGLLAVTCFFVNLPSRESGLHNYRKSRQILGLAMFIIALYCIIRLFIPQQNEQFTDFWLLVLFTFYFSWLSYSSLLFLIETPRYTTRIFLIDGLIPLVLLLVLGVVGLFVPKSRYVLQFLFGLVYMIKNVWMFHTCTKEYNRCKNEIDNYYDIGPDITWIRILLILSLIMGLSAVPAFYMPQKYQIIYFAVPIIYSYLVFKVVNFAAKKIERINRRHLNQEIQTEGG